MNFFVVAGEVSGDIHTARLMHAMKKLNTDIHFSGIGGDNMISEGLEAHYHIRQMAFLGIGEVIKHLPFIRQVLKRIKNVLSEEKPVAVILVDYPGLNLRVAKMAYQLNIPVIYYISPQLWAWGRKRIRKIKKYVSKMIVLFPFEMSFYQNHGVDAFCPGHPLADRHYHHIKPKHFKKENAVLGLLPGSRTHEIDMLFSDMLETAKILFNKKMIHTVKILKAPHINTEYYQNYLGSDFSFAELCTDAEADFFNSIDAAMVKSGTSTLETAYFRVPFVIVYRVNWLTWFLGNLLVKLNMIGLSNIVAEYKIADELLQSDFTPQKAAEILEQLLQKEMNQAKRSELKIIKEKLGEPGVAQRTAQHILKFMNQLDE